MGKMLRFGVVFIVAWIIFVILSTISMVFTAIGGNWLEAILYSLLVGAIIGLILAAVAFLLTRFLKFSSWIFILVTILMGITGILTSVLFYYILDSIPRIPWEMIQPDPPVKPIEFVGNSSFLIWGGAIFIKTENGDLYSHECIDSEPCTWKKLDAIPDQPYNRCLKRRVPSYRTPKTPPGKVIDNYVLNYCGPDFSIQHNWLILEDGSIWHWSRYHAALEFFLYVLIGIIGGISGLLSSFVLLVIRKSKNIW